MGYKVPDWKKSIKQGRFEVEVDGKEYSLPRIEYLSGAQAQQFAEADETPNGIYEVLDELAPGLGTALRDVPVKYVRELVLEWRKDSGIGPGESAAS